MGEAKTRITRFIEQHPKCCLCGGSVDTETREHAPPKILFVGSQRPNELVVPACKRCNNGTAQNDIIVSGLTAAQSPKSVFSRKADYDAHITKCFNGIRNDRLNVLDLLQDPQRKTARSSGGLIQNVVKVSIKKDVIDNVFRPWAAKQGLALWYDTHNQCFSDNGIVFVEAFQTDSLLPNSPAVTNITNGLLKYDTLKQGKISVEDQYKYWYDYDTDNQVFAINIFVHETFQFLVVMLGNDAAEYFERNSKGEKYEFFQTNAEQGIHLSSIN